MITAGPDSIWESQKGLNLDGMNVPSEVMVLPFLNLLATHSDPLTFHLPVTKSENLLQTPTGN